MLIMAFFLLHHTSESNDLYKRPQYTDTRYLMYRYIGGHKKPFYNFTELKVKDSGSGQNRMIFPDP